MIQQTSHQKFTQKKMSHPFSQRRSSFLKNKNMNKDQSQPSLKKTIKRIGSNPPLQPFQQEVPLEQSNNRNKECEYKFKQKQNINCEVTEKQVKVKNIKNCINFNVSQNRKLKRIGRKVWVNAYKKQVDDAQLSQQVYNNKQMKFLEIPNNNIPQKQTHLSNKSTGQTYSIIRPSSRQNQSDQYFSSFLQEEPIQRLQKSYLDKMNRDTKNLQQKQQLYINKNEQQIPQQVVFKKTYSASNKDRDKDKNRIKEQQKSLADNSQKDEEVLQKNQSSILDQENIFEQNQPKNIDINKIMYEYEKKIEQYSQQHPIPKINSRKSIVSIKRNSKKINQKLNQMVSQPINVSLTSNPVSSIKKNNNIIKKPLPPAYPFIEQTRLLSSLPISTIQQSQNKVDIVNQNKPEQIDITQSILMKKFINNRGYKKQNTLNQASLKPLASKSTTKSMINSVHKSPPIRQQRHDKVNSKSMHSSLNKESKQFKQRKFQVNRYIQDAKREVKKNSHYY